MRRSSKNINQTLKKQIISTFARTLADYKNPEQVEDFLKDFFTEAELETFAKRLAVSYWLKKGRSYQNIKENLKVSSATISSAQEAMDTKGIKEALRLMEAEEWANQWAIRIQRLFGKKIAAK